jgi:hypothetical protein
MINLPNKDRFIYDLEYRVADIVKEYYNEGKINLSVNSEGICLKRCGFYDLLDYLCQQFNIDKRLITIHTPNTLEEHEFYNIEKYPNHWFRETRQSIPKDYYPVKNTNFKPLGCFIGKINWNRLILGSYIFKNYQNKILLTCHYRGEDSQKKHSELTDLNFYDSKSLADAIEFLNHCPIVLDENFNSFTIGPPDHLTILKHYKNFFAELVLETYVIGNTFFPTEKTLRPIIAKTPFIIMGSKGYLNNLKNIGFKTFGHWWDESYDHLEGVSRVEEIKKILDLIFSWSTETLENKLLEMQEILDYNYNHFMNNKYDNKK